MIIEALYMPEQFGGKKLAEDFRTMLQSTIQKAMLQSKSIIQEAANELADTMKEQATGAAKAIRAEAQHVRDTFGEYTGNNPQDEEETDGKPDPTTLNGSGEKT